MGGQVGRSTHPSSASPQSEADTFFLCERYWKNKSSRAASVHFALSNSVLATDPQFHRYRSKIDKLDEAFLKRV